MTRFMIGDAQVDSALELSLTGRPIATLGAPPELIAQHRHWLEPHFLQSGDQWSLDFRSWIVRADDKVIVIDPCTGNGRANVMPMFHMLDIPFIERFEATGTRTEDVDFVFCTHLHHDHCGWNTMLRDGRWVPTFPNARYIFTQREYARWHPDNAAAFKHLAFNDGVYEQSIAPIVDAGLADLVDGAHRLTHGLTVEPAYGHSHGHAMLHLVSAGAQAMFCGDAIHHPLQLIEPSIYFGDHDDADGVVAVRRQLARRSIDDAMLIVPAHLPFPHAGWLRSGAAGPWFEAMPL